MINMKRQWSKYTLGGGARRRSAPLVSEFIGHYLLLLFLKRPPRPLDFLGTETRTKWLVESDDSVNEGREAGAVGSGPKESSKNNLLQSSSGSTLMESLVVGPRGTIFKGGGAGFLYFLDTLQLWLR